MCGRALIYGGDGGKKPTNERYIFEIEGLGFGILDSMATTSLPSTPNPRPNTNRREIHLGQHGNHFLACVGILPRKRGIRLDIAGRWRLLWGSVVDGGGRNEGACSRPGPTILQHRCCPSTDFPGDARGLPRHVVILCVGGRRGERRARGGSRCRLLVRRRCTVGVEVGGPRFTAGRR